MKTTLFLGLIQIYLGLCIEEELVERVIKDEEDYDIRTLPPSGDLVTYAANNASASTSQGAHNTDDRTYRNGSKLFPPRPLPLPPTNPPPVPRPAIPTDTPEMLIQLTQEAWRELGFTREAMDSPLGEFFKYYSVFPYVDSKGPARTWVRLLKTLFPFCIILLWGEMMVSYPHDFLHILFTENITKI